MSDNAENRFPLPLPTQIRHLILNRSNNDVLVEYLKHQIDIHQTGMIPHILL
jgi:hypothetical protein